MNIIKKYIFIYTKILWYVKFYNKTKLHKKKKPFTFNTNLFVFLLNILKLESFYAYYCLPFAFFPYKKKLNFRA